MRILLLLSALFSAIAGIAPAVANPARQEIALAVVKRLAPSQIAPSHRPANTVSNTKAMAVHVTVAAAPCATSPIYAERLRV